MQIPFAKVDCSGRELELITEVLRSGWLTTAGKAMEFEKRFAATVGATHACAVNSCTAALHLGLEALGVGPGDKVLVPSMTFTASAEVIRYLGADPVFLDVDYGTRLVTPEIVEAALAQHPDAKALVVVHFGGQAAQMLGGEGAAPAVSSKSSVVSGGEPGVSGQARKAGEASRASPPTTPHPQLPTPHSPPSTDALPTDALSTDALPTDALSTDALSTHHSPLPTPPGLLAVCQRHGLRVLEDAAHAFPTRHQGRLVGAFGDVTCFSFYANKTITTGEGGMLTTEDEAVYRRIKAMRLHGISRDIWDRFTSAKAGWEYDVIAPGFKYNMPDVNAAIGLAQLERAEEFRLGRERCCRFYDQGLADIGCIDLPQRNCAYEDHSWHLYPIVLKPGAPKDRNGFIEGMTAAGIGTSVHYKPLHRMTYYRETYMLDPADFPNTERIWQGTVSLPVYPGLTDDELGYICQAIHDLLS